MHQSVFEQGSGPMITKRDQDVLNFLEEFHIGTSIQIHNLFFSNTSLRYSRKRLQYLYENGLIKRTKSLIDNSNAYYIDKKPSQVHHDLIRAQVYTAMKRQYNLLDWANEAPVSSIRPDALCYIDSHGIVFPVMVEIHLNNKFDFDKYKGIDFRALFGILPRVLIVTDRHVTIPQIGIKFKVISLDMHGLGSIFK